MSPRRAIRLAAALAAPFALPAADPGRGETAAALERARRELREPIAFKLSNGRTLRGHPAKVADERLGIAVAEGAGQVVHTIPFDRIEAVDPPGEHYRRMALRWLEDGRSGDAHRLMELLFIQRAELLPLLPPGNAHFFIPYAELQLDTPKPARAIAIAEKLEPHIGSEQARRALDDTILNGFQTLGLHGEAVPLANDWVAERKPYGDSALGYYVLAAHRLRQNDPGSALEHALKPIVFAARPDTPRLAHCYAVAAAAALRLRERDYARSLLGEMRGRGLGIPEDAGLDPWRERLREALQTDETS